jgi:Reverse transcriptase (RNA-dependent DNA polymerase)
MIRRIRHLRWSMTYLRIIFTIIVMAGFWAEVVDVRGAFLTVVVLLLKRTLYGTCQAAIQFWKKLCAVMSMIMAKRSNADVCLFYQWTPDGLLVFISWVDDILIAGKKEDVLRAKKALARHFTLDEQGEMLEYVGCKVERDLKNRWMKLTQPVMIQSFKNEFDLPEDLPALPSPPGEILCRTAGEPLDEAKTSKYRSGTGKIMHMMKWSRHDILNRERELSRFMAVPTSLHLKRLYRLMSYVRRRR